MRAYDIKEITIFSSIRSSLGTLDFIAVQRLTPFDFISFPFRPFVEICIFSAYYERIMRPISIKCKSLSRRISTPFAK